MSGSLIDNNTAVLIVSDVHLGATGVEYDDFNKFLTIIYSMLEQDALKSLKVLIIAGDFFDLCMDSYRDLAREDIYLEIYDNLIKLQEKKIKIIVALGNHEIPTTFFHDWLFKWRKKKFIKRFSKQFESNKRYFSFFEKLFFCQYCLLKQNSENKLEIYLCDRKKKCARDKKSKVKLDLDVITNMNEDQTILFTHGYQFEPWFLLFIVSFIWALNMRSPDKIKQFYNFLYNDLYEGTINKQKLKETQKEDIKKILDQRKVKYTSRDVRRLKKFTKRNVKAIDRREEIKDKNDRYFKKVFKFLKDEKYSHISHVIFGHTHKDGSDKDANKTTLNAGAWKHVDKAHYIEILANGEIILEGFELN